MSNNKTHALLRSNVWYYKRMYSTGIFHLWLASLKSVVLDYFTKAVIYGREEKKPSALNLWKNIMWEFPTYGFMQRLRFCSQLRAINKRPGTSPAI